MLRRDEKKDSDDEDSEEQGDGGSEGELRESEPGWTVQSSDADGAEVLARGDRGADMGLLHFATDSRSVFSERIRCQT